MVCWLASYYLNVYSSTIPVCPSYWRVSLWIHHPLSKINLDLVWRLVHWLTWYYFNVHSATLLICPRYWRVSLLIRHPVSKINLVLVWLWRLVHWQLQQSYMYMTYHSLFHGRSFQLTWYYLNVHSSTIPVCPSNWRVFLSIHHPVSKLSLVLVWWLVHWQLQPSYIYMTYHSLIQWWTSLMNKPLDLLHHYFPWHCNLSVDVWAEIKLYSL